MLERLLAPPWLPVCPVVHWNCTGFVCLFLGLLGVSVWRVNGLGPITYLLTAVKPGGKNFPLTSVETSAGSVCLWGKLMGIVCVTVKRGLFSWSCRSAEDVMPASLMEEQHLQPPVPAQGCQPS